MKIRLAAAALASAVSLSLAPVPAQAQQMSSLPAVQIPNVQAMINDALRQAQALSSQFIPGAPVPAARASAEQQALIDATNRYRARHGLHPLRPMPQLNSLSQDWANTMARDGRVRHRPNYQNRFPRGWRMAAENVAMVRPGDNADQIVAFWATSPGHRANMLRPDATHIGVGVAYGAGGKFAVQDFARY